ncbi:MAG: hypothetical protein LBN03_03035 [Bifidobacteriaceae bacterium]|jgi:hypothetical protein|nr:hypothetical protein [Bifidobacteriaceae bacterium]
MKNNKIKETLMKYNFSIDRIFGLCIMSFLAIIFLIGVMQYRGSYNNWGLKQNTAIAQTHTGAGVNYWSWHYNYDMWLGAYLVADATGKVFEGFCYESWILAGDPGQYSQVRKSTYDPYMAYIFYHHGISSSGSADEDNVQRAGISFLVHDRYDGTVAWNQNLRPQWTNAGFLNESAYNIGAYNRRNTFEAEAIRGATYSYNQISMNYGYLKESGDITRIGTKNQTGQNTSVQYTLNVTSANGHLVADDGSNVKSITGYTSMNGDISRKWETDTRGAVTVEIKYYDIDPTIEYLEDPTFQNMILYSRPSINLMAQSAAALEGVRSFVPTVSTEVGSGSSKAVTMYIVQESEDKVYNYGEKIVDNWVTGVLGAGTGAGAGAGTGGSGSGAGGSGASSDLGGGTWYADIPVRFDWVSYWSESLPEQSDEIWEESSVFSQGYLDVNPGGADQEFEVEISGDECDGSGSSGSGAGGSSGSGGSGSDGFVPDDLDGSGTGGTGRSSSSDGSSSDGSGSPEDVADDMDGFGCVAPGYLTIVVTFDKDSQPFGVDPDYFTRSWHDDYGQESETAIIRQSLEHESMMENRYVSDGDNIIDKLVISKFPIGYIADSVLTDSVLTERGLFEFDSDSGSGAGGSGSDSDSSSDSGSEDGDGADVVAQKCGEVFIEKCAWYRIYGPFASIDELNLISDTVRSELDSVGLDSGFVADDDLGSVGLDSGLDMDSRFRGNDNRDSGFVADDNVNSSFLEVLNVYYETALYPQNGIFEIGGSFGDKIVTPSECGYYVGVYSYDGDSQVQAFSSDLDDIRQTFNVPCIADPPLAMTGVSYYGVFYMLLIFGSFGFYLIYKKRLASDAIIEKYFELEGDWN